MMQNYARFQLAGRGGEALYVKCLLPTSAIALLRSPARVQASTNVAPTAIPYAWMWDGAQTWPCLSEAFVACSSTHDQSCLFLVDFIFALHALCPSLPFLCLCKRCSHH